MGKDILITFAVAGLVSGYQVYRCLDYLRDSIRISHNYADKTEQGCVQPWEYLFFFIPIRYRDYYSKVGLQGGDFYVTPIVGLLALLSGNLLGWIAVLVCVLFSLGGGVFKLLSTLFLRLPFYWAYFVSLILVMLSVEALRSLSLNNRALTLLCVVLGLLLLFNSFNLPLYPEGMWHRKPSEYFDTPLLRWLEKYAKGYRVNNMKYPYYHGHINHIRSMGYCGGNHKKWVGEIRGLPSNGGGGYNWFDYKEDGVDLDIYEVGFHIGERPSENEKWFKAEVIEDVWINRNVVEPREDYAI